MKKLSLPLLIFLAVLIASALVVLMIRARLPEAPLSPTPPQPSPSPSALLRNPAVTRDLGDGTVLIEGRVVRIEGDTIVLAAQGGEPLSVRTDEGTEITGLNPQDPEGPGIPLTLKDFKPDDRVSMQAEVHDDGTLRAIGIFRQR